MIVVEAPISAFVGPIDGFIASRCLLQEIAIDGIAAHFRIVCQRT
jgi:hypothetical protein